MQPGWGRKRLVLIAVGLFVLIAGAGFARFVTKVHAMRARTASGPAWSFPSRVYSAGVTLIEGRPLPLDYLRAQLEARDYRTDPPPLVDPGTYWMSGARVEIFLRGFDEADPAGSGGPQHVRLRIERGQLLEVELRGSEEHRAGSESRTPPRLEPVLIALLTDSHRVRRTWVPLSRVPRVVRDAVVAAEDRRFYGHHGLDLRSSLRALVANVRSGGVREGGSTITQQLARGLFLGSKRTWARKVAEAFTAVGLELVLTKDQILEMYLNSAYWGRADGGDVAGIAEAARWYFDRPVESLDPSQAALLAGLIPAPNAFSPFRKPRVARRCRDAVLRDMVQTGALDTKTADRIKRSALRVRRGPPPPQRFPSFTGYVRDQLDDALPKGLAEHGGLAVFTTIDVVWQERAERGLTEGVAALERWRGRMSEPLQGAFVALEPGTGYLRALVGGRGFSPGDFNRGTRARRQPGSAIKPIVYAAALDPERGGPRLTPATTVPDLRRVFTTSTGPWSPQNDEGDYHEQVTLAKALARSLNVATSNVVDAIGPAAVARYAERFGLGRLKPVASIGLGSNEVTLLDLTAAYAAFPNGGWRRDPTGIRAVVNARGEVLLAPTPRPRRVLSEDTAVLMTGLLEDVVIFGVAYPLRARYGFYGPLGGKTGTTNDYLDAWFVGFTPEIAAGVWIGYDTPASLARPAAETAIPVWAGIMHRLVDGFPPGEFRGQDRLELAWIDPWSGGLARSDCPRPMRVPFLNGTAPTKPCSRDHATDWEAIFAERLADSLEAAARDSANAESAPEPDFP